jgi:hypothetical protein
VATEEYRAISTVEHKIRGDSQTVDDLERVMSEEFRQLTRKRTKCIQVFKKVKRYCSRTHELVIAVESWGIAHTSVLQGRIVVRTKEKVQDFKASVVPVE